jgi:hypothetical protein
MSINEKYTKLDKRFNDLCDAYHKLYNTHRIDINNYMDKLSAQNLVTIKLQSENEQLKKQLIDAQKEIKHLKDINYMKSINNKINQSIQQLHTVPSISMSDNLISNDFDNDNQIVPRQHKRVRFANPIYS